ncbi:protein phosphatase 2C domain-containing protein [Pengzhenrongella sp.]|uniref:protein phosphatase 2C domain-containing protein n=1 Tax=Pengzhenrongella sp. TaxID=2888820 RepID=UPI002F922E5B
MIVDAATLAGGANNQDAYAVVGRALVVLDGASAFPPVRPERDGGWYARTLRDAIRERLPESDHSLARILADSIAQVRDDYELRPGGPSSTVVMARVNIDTVDVLVLGDSTLVIQHPDDTCTAIIDDRLAQVAKAKRKGYREQLRDGGGYDDEHVQRLAGLQAAQRLVRNQPGGYWIAESDPAAATQAISRTVPLDQVHALLLLTDGAAAGVVTYGAPKTWPELVQQVDSAGAQQVLDGLHELEETDPAGQRWPRSKPHDDKTVILVRDLISGA